MSVGHGRRWRLPTSSCSCARRSEASPPRHGLVASLAPKPWPDQAGNGASHPLQPVGHAAAPKPLPRPRRSLRAVRPGRAVRRRDPRPSPGAAGLTAPSFNSYQRLLPQHWSSAYTCWGPDNREAAVRVPSTFWGEEAGVDQPRVQAGRRLGQPVHRLRRPDRRRARRRRARPRTAPAGRRSTPPTSPRLSARPAGSAAIRRRLEDALGRLEDDDVLMKALGEPLSRALPRGPALGVGGLLRRPTRPSSSPATS